MELDGVTAIVTGGGSGLGEASAKALAAAGAKVAIFDLNQENAERVAGEVGGSAHACDVSDGPQTEATIAAAREALGAARVLINCAGIGVSARAVSRKGPLPLEQFTRVIEINLIGTFNAIRLAAADMLALEPLGDTGGRGVIINTASVAATEGQIGQPAYAASKGGVSSMTLPLAREFASNGIRVNTISPGLFKTPMMFTLPPDVQKALGDSVPFPSRLGTPEEYADLAVHICRNDMINGETIRLDGALRMAPR